MKGLILSGIWATYSIALAILFFFGMPFFEFLFLFLLPIVLVMIIAIILECRRYGRKKVFQFQLKEPLADRRDIFLNSLQNQVNSKVFITDRNDKMIMIVNSNGIYLYCFIHEKGILLEQENIWYIKEGKEEREIENPIRELEKEQHIIEEKLGLSINNSLVLDSYTYFQKGNKEYPILTITKAPFYLCKTDSFNQLSDEEIDKTVKDILEKLDYKLADEKSIKKC